MAAWSYSGRCYSSEVEALAGFIESMPMVNAQGITKFTGTPSVNASGVLSWNYSTLEFSSSSVRTGSSTTQLLTCTPEDVAYDAVGGFGFFSLTMGGILFTYFFSVGIGLLLKAVKQW